MIIYINAAGCSNVCRHCGSGGRPPYGGFYSLDELRAIARDWGPVWPYFEVTAHPEFPDILEPLVVGEGNAAFPPTNGFGLAERDDYQEVFGRLRELGCKGLSFTLHGLEDKHDWFVCRKGAYQTILKAGRRAAEAGFKIHWNVFLDRLNLDEVPTLLELGKREFGASTGLELPCHRVSRRSWRYERLRPELGGVKKLFEGLGLEGLYGQPLEELTESALLSEWKRQPDSDRIRHPNEPRSWPPVSPFDNIVLRFDRTRRVYMDPMCSEPILLGELADGRDEILRRLGLVSAPPFVDISPADAMGIDDDSELLHPEAGSVRLKAISAAAGCFGEGGSRKS